MRSRWRILIPGLGAAIGMFRPLYTWTLGLVLRYNLRQLNAGNVEPLLRTYAEDATLVFPGQNTWTGEYRGRKEIRGFLERFVAAGLQGEAHEVIVKGPPWNAIACVVFTVHARGEGGKVVYENRAILLPRIAWGKVVHQEDFEDTQRVPAFEQYLASRE